nr:iron-containing alcohol dehydrogenase [Alicyclobacillus herbarius]
MFLPHVLKFNAAVETELHRDIAVRTGFARSDDAPEAAVAKLVEGIAVWTRQLGIPRLSELPGVHPNDFPVLAKLAYANGLIGTDVWRKRPMPWAPTIPTRMPMHPPRRPTTADSVRNCPRIDP